MSEKQAQSLAVIKDLFNKAVTLEKQIKALDEQTMHIVAAFVREQKEKEKLQVQNHYLKQELEKLRRAGQTPRPVTVVADSEGR